MKKKLLVFTLCFTLIFSSLNYKKSYADGGIISLPMLATVSALAVGTGIVISDNDDLFDIGRIFYDYIDRHNDLTWATVQSVFASSVVLQSNKLVSVKSDFLDIVKEFFDSIFTFNSDVIYADDIPLLPNYFTVSKDFLPSSYTTRLVPTDINISYGRYTGIMQLAFTYTSSGSRYVGFDLYDTNGKMLVSDSVRINSFGSDIKVSLKQVFNAFKLVFTSSTQTLETSSFNILSGLVDFPYKGGYTWDNVEDRKENDKSIGLPIPGNLGSLVGQGSTDFWDNTDNLVGDKPLTYPNVGNPSISVDSSTTFPNTNVDTDSGVGNPSIPNEGIWATIKEFIISLVVPSDTFWTDTWGGLYNNFTSSFPMVDMDGFNDLVTGEKKFPNIDINIMGVKGRVVNGDVINSIVDWLRPIIAGFMMLCLMFFNYRKIYKLIRNSEPFGGIAPGNNSDIRTGISEYSKHEVVKATDMVAEYHAWKERGGK